MERRWCNLKGSWAVELKSGQSHTVPIPKGELLRVTHASLGAGNLKKGGALLFLLKMELRGKSLLDTRDMKYNLIYTDDHDFVEFSHDSDDHSDLHLVFLDKGIEVYF
uniref:Uncharacterized protein n=1 Tax=Tanacetum cinerariifolium TaxID=118510 RepID=A0A6L2K2R7_TANCI|nr:hypothetical protein [Tanacetum cinerariifolium]